MGKISEFLKRIFRRQPKMLNSGERKEVVENMSTSKNDIKKEVKEEIQGLKFREELKKQAEVSKIDPSRYERTDDLYMAILEEMGVSQNFKDNPKAKEDLTNMIKDIINEQPEYKRDRYTRLQNENNSKSLMDLLNENISVDENGKKILYKKQFVPVAAAEGVQQSEGKAIMLSISEENYSKEEMFASIIYDNREKNNSKGSINKSKRIHTYDKDGIENKFETVSYKEEPTDVGYRRVNQKGAACPSNFSYKRMKDLTKDEERGRITTTRLSSFKGNENNLANFATVQINVTGEYKEKYGSGNVTLNSQGSLTSIDRNYDLAMATLKRGTVEDKMLLDRFHNSDGSSIDENVIESELMDRMNSWDSFETSDSKRILKNRIAQITGKDENSMEVDD